MKVAAADIDYQSVAERAVELLCSVGCFGLDRSKQRELWQRGLDLDRELHPGRPRTIVWTEAEGDVDPPRRESGEVLPVVSFG